MIVMVYYDRGPTHLIFRVSFMSLHRFEQLYINTCKVLNRFYVNNIYFWPGPCVYVNLFNSEADVFYSRNLFEFDSIYKKVCLGVVINCEYILIVGIVYILLVLFGLIMWCHWRYFRIRFTNCTIIFTHRWPSLEIDVLGVIVSQTPTLHLV